MKAFNSSAFLLLFVFLLKAFPTSAHNDVSGHIKSQLHYQTFPHDSVIRELVGANTQEGSGDLRVKFSSQKDTLSLQADYQLIARFGEALGTEASSRLTEDDRRLWDLTHTTSENKHRTVQHRLDRLYVDYIGEKLVARFGRQVVSWGNGLIFSPLDFFNPFDPTAVDKEYKTGDDMFYGQYLQDSGNDIQAVWVFRRDVLSGELEQDVSSQALKYHAFSASSEIDILVASHYEDTILGFGIAKDLAGAVVRADVSLTHTGGENVYSFVSNASYSWMAFGKNMTGSLEYFYNGFGITNGDYSPENLQQYPRLSEAVTRGELYTLARQYLASSVSIELTPLFTVSPNLFVNINDGSALFQTVGQYNRWQNLQLLFSVNVPIGEKGTEYGGAEAMGEGRYYSAGASASIQLGWYF